MWAFSSQGYACQEVFCYENNAERITRDSFRIDWFGLNKNGYKEIKIVLAFTVEHDHYTRPESFYYLIATEVLSFKGRNGIKHWRLLSTNAIRVRVNFYWETFLNFQCNWIKLNKLVHAYIHIRTIKYGNFGYIEKITPFAKI